MWSPFYGYYEIRASAAYDGSVPTAVLKQFLCGLPGLREKMPLCYETTADPRVWLTLTNTSDGNYAVNAETWHEHVNLVAAVCAKEAAGNVLPGQLALLTSIAGFLRWELVEELTDDGQENVVLWPALH